ncbi:ras guanine nucleotide exchange factor domain-containing protein [Parasitella parasitica]|nr:ras guanine nucleotide exchange factor domain-containing protein [Parasitella parasitica]
MDDDDEDEEEDDYMEYDSSDEEEDDDEEVIVNTKLKASQQKRKASAPSLKLLKTSTNRPKLPRRSSTSNLSSTSAPSSPLSSVSIPINAVKSFLSLPGSMASHTTNRTGMYSVVAGDSNGPASNGDDIFLLANSTIDPNVLITVQTSNSDSLSTPTGINSNYLPMIPQAPLVTVYQSLQKQLEDALELKKKGGQDIGYANQQVLDIQSSLNRVRNIHMSATTVPTVLQFQPVLIAYQLTLIDSTIFRNIPVEAILSHAPKTPHPSIVASTDFFNYLTRLIEHAILLQQEASGRAQHINHWIKVAGKCHELKNYQTLKAVISALGTPPIQRLKRAWQFIPKKSMHLLEDLSDFMSEASNYGKYRRCLGLTQSSSEEETKNRTESEDSTVSSSSTAPSKKSSTRKNSFNEPTVPFLGIFIHDMTYLLAAQSKKKQQHNSDWKIEATSTTSDAMHQDSRVSELLRLFKNLQRSPPYSPNLSASCIKDLNKNRKRKLSHALSRNAAIKRAPAYYHDDAGELSIELQQCLVTQYLLTRSWVSEKTVDELSLVREPTKRSFSVADSLSSHQNQQVPPTPPPLTSSVSLTTTDQHHQQQQQGGILRSSSGSFTSGGSNSSNSRPISLEDDQQEAEVMDKKNTGFWLFGRKSADQGYLKETSAFGTMQRSPRHFSFEDLNRKQHATIPSISSQENNSSGTFRMNREGSQSSLASAIFRKDFWKGGSQQQQQQHSKGPLTSFNSDPSLMQRKGSTASSVSVHLSPSTSSSALFTASAVAAASAATSGNTATAAAAAAAATVTPSPSSSNRTLNNKNLRHVLSSPHPLDLSSSTSPTAVAPATTPLSEISSFNWD